MSVEFQGREGRSDGVGATHEAAKVLLVDDEERNLDILETILDSSDCCFIRARSADEALFALLHHDFAAIVLDIKMPASTQWLDSGKLTMSLGYGHRTRSGLRHPCSRGLESIVSRRKSVEGHGHADGFLRKTLEIDSELLARLECGQDL